MNLLKWFGITKKLVFCNGCVFYEGHGLKNQCAYKCKKIKTNITPIHQQTTYISIHSCEKLNANNDCKYWMTELVIM